jgi:hypothetical protein
MAQTSFPSELSRLKANFHSGKLSVDWNGQEKSLVPTQSSQDKENFSCPFQPTDNFPEWKLALTYPSKQTGKLDGNPI